VCGEMRKESGVEGRGVGSLKSKFEWNTLKNQCKTYLFQVRDFWLWEWVRGGRKRMQGGEGLGRSENLENRKRLRDINFERPLSGGTSFVNCT